MLLGSLNRAYPKCGGRITRKEMQVSPEHSFWIKRDWPFDLDEPTAPW